MRGAGGAEEGVGLPIGSSRLARWIINASSFGLVMSLLLHVLITLLAAVVTVSIARTTLRGSGGGEFDLTLTSEVPLAGIMNADLPETPSPNVPDAQMPELSTGGILEGAGGIDAPGAGAGLGTIADGLGGAGGGEVGDGAGLGAGGAGGGGASFFGVEAKGSRFLYICDVSGSMNWDESGAPNGKRLRTLKSELTESINALLEHMSFYVIFFNSEAHPINDKSNKWIVATDQSKKWAVERVGNVNAFGGTEPWPAFELSFTMRPPPDAIYFMTDGNFNTDVAMQIAARNVGSRRVPIHCITLVDKTGEEVMRRIAAESGGTYTHVEGTR